MIVAQCQFENSKGLSQPYSYAIDPRLAEQLMPGADVVVTGSRNRYGVAVFAGLKEITDPEELKLVTQHVCCEIRDEYKER